MAAVAVLVVNPASGGLLRVQTEFRVALPSLDIAGAERKHHGNDRSEPQDGPKIEFAIPVVHCSQTLHSRQSYNHKAGPCPSEPNKFRSSAFTRNPRPEMGRGF